MLTAVLSRHAHAVVAAAIVTLWILALIALWRSDVDHPRNEDDDSEQDQDQAEVRLAA